MGTRGQVSHFTLGDNESQVLPKVTWLAAERIQASWLLDRHLPHPRPLPPKHSLCKNSKKISLRALPEENLRKCRICMTWVSWEDRPLQERVEGNLWKPMEWHARPAASFEGGHHSLFFTDRNVTSEGKKPNAWEQAQWSQGLSFLPHC